MAVDEADVLFARFRRTRDPECLGQVFDRLAPRLLLVAERLVRSRALAEDLVQATFVSAIEAAAGFDGTRPVMPWLCGILANHARMARRKERRAPDREPLTEDNARRAAHAPPPDAATVADLAELATRIGSAVDALPEQQRTALVLRLFHGLRPLEIARALGRSPETVRTWLHRGLSELRRTLRGGALPAALLLEEGRGLPAVRAAVLGHAALTGPVAVVALAGGVVLMKKVVVAAVISVA